MNPKRNYVGPGLVRQTIQIPSTQTGNGQIQWLNTGDFPVDRFTMQVTLLDSSGNFIPSPSGAPTWNVQLQGSLDGQAANQILSHISGTQTNGQTVAINSSPWDYLIVNWSNLNFGNAATIQIIFLAVPSVNLKG